MVRELDGGLGLDRGEKLADFEKIDLAFLRKRAAAKAAMTVGGPWIRRLMAHLRKMRDDGAKRLNTIPGVQCPVPQATPFLFPNVASFGLTSREMVEYLREEAKVIVMNGAEFGPDGEGHIRINVATANPVLQEAMDRIEKALRAL